MSRLILPISSITRRFRDAFKVSSDAPYIARRLFVTNSIDSITSSLGVNIGAYTPDIDPRVMILAVLGGSLSLSLISGFMGVFMSERAERLRELRGIEKKLGARLRSPLYAGSATLIPLYVALWSSIGMLLFPSAIVTPYIVALTGALGVREAFLISIAIALASLASIGVYLGSITGERVLFSALRTLGLGLLALIIVAVFKLVLGAAMG